jgi:hypothetical protein
MFTEIKKNDLQVQWTDFLVRKILSVLVVLGEWDTGVFATVINI